MQTGIFIVFEGGDVKKTWVSQRGAVRIITVNATCWNAATVACRAPLTCYSRAFMKHTQPSSSGDTEENIFTGDANAKASKVNSDQVMG